MDWVPVSKETFEGILAEELEALRPEVMRLYEQYAVPPFQLPCLRGENSVTEYVFVLAKQKSGYSTTMMLKRTLGLRFLMKTAY